MTPAEKVLSRASGVRKTGHHRWMFQNPCRDKQRTGSVAMRELDDGKVLIYDFAGDDVETVVQGLGLEIGDLFPDSLVSAQAPKKRALISPFDALRILADESNLIAIAAANIAHGITLSDEDRARILVAAGRIQAIEQEVHL